MNNQPATPPTNAAMRAAETVACPFCAEPDFDPIGLKSHLVHDCIAYAEVGVNNILFPHAIISAHCQSESAKHGPMKSAEGFAAENNGFTILRNDHASISLLEAIQADAIASVKRESVNGKLVEALSVAQIALCSVPADNTMPDTYMRVLQSENIKPALNMIQSALASAASAPENDELVKDKERLDWLEAHKAGLNFAQYPHGPHVWFNLSQGDMQHTNADSYRQAIDAARKSQEKE